jgi:FkbM family methyltransferase
MKVELSRFLRDAEDYWFHVYTPSLGDVIVDIGAGRGEDVYAFARAVSREGRVWAFEPHPESFRILESFCHEYGLRNVTALRYACVDRQGPVQIETLPAWESNYLRYGEPSPTSFAAEGRRFDDLAAAYGIQGIDFLKMNIEGAERLALPGCIESLRRTRYVCVAAHDFRADEGEAFRTMHFVKNFLASAGFAVTTRESDPRDYVSYHVHGVNRSLEGG